MILTLPDDLVTPLADEARRRGTTPEQLALDGVRQVIAMNTVTSNNGSLLDTLAGHIGVVEGTGEAFSQDCGRKFADGLAAGRVARP